MKQMRRVVITGLGIVSPLGNNLQTFWHLLSTGESGIAPLSSFDTAPFSSSLAGEVKDFDAEDFIPRKQARRMGRVSHFAVAAALMAVACGTPDWTSSAKIVRKWRFVWARLSQDCAKRLLRTTAC